MVVITGDDWVVIGVVTAPHGVGGEIRVLPTTDFPERFGRLRECRLASGDQVITYKVRSVRPHRRFYLIRLAGVDDREAAQDLRNARLVIRRNEVMPLPEGHYYVFDLEGISVYTTLGEDVGALAEVVTGPANDIYVIRRAGRPDALIPAVRQVIKEVDVRNRRMVIDPIPGLLDEEVT